MNDKQLERNKSEAHVSSTTLHYQFVFVFHLLKNHKSEEKRKKKGDWLLDVIQCRQNIHIKGADGKRKKANQAL